MKDTTELSNLQQSRLAEALKESGMMQKDLAALLGYTPAGLNRIFKGKVSLKRKTAQLIGRALSVRPEWLLGEDHIKTPVKSKWMLNRFEGLFNSFHLAGYEIEQIDGGVLDPYLGLVPEKRRFYHSYPRRLPALPRNVCGDNTAVKFHRSDRTGIGSELRPYKLPR